MRNHFKRIVFFAVVAAIGIGLVSCDNFLGDGEQTVITIVGLTQFEGKYASGGLASADATSREKRKNKDTALAMPKRISGGTVTWELITADGKSPASINSQLAYVILLISDDNSVTNTTDYYMLPSRIFTEGVQTQPLVFPDDFVLEQ